ncbi:MAG: RNA methyltransferase [Fibrobacteres bacterium]|nr:RNA methyltransferase [Fibrobacterota bacterium]
MEDRAGRDNGNRGFQPRSQQEPSRDARRDSFGERPHGERPQQARSFHGQSRLEFPREARGGASGFRDNRFQGGDRRANPRPAREDQPIVERENAAEIVCGQHAVQSLLESEPRRIQRLLLERGAGEPRLYELQKLAEENGVPCQQLMAKELSVRALGRRHQGVVAVCNVREFAEWTELREKLAQSVKEGGNPIVVVAAAIEDPRNLGAVVRTCVGMGVKGLLLPRKGGCGLTPIVEETSAGTLTHLPVARPNDLENVLEDLSALGFLVVGLDARGEEIRTVSFPGPVVLVAGGEDRGIPPHLRRPCARLIRLPMNENLQSYNASVAAAIALYEITRNRL